MQVSLFLLRHSVAHATRRGSSGRLMKAGLISPVKDRKLLAPAQVKTVTTMGRQRLVQYGVEMVETRLINERAQVKPCEFVAVFNLLCPFRRILGGGLA